MIRIIYFDISIRKTNSYAYYDVTDARSIHLEFFNQSYRDTHNYYVVDRETLRGLC